MTDVVATEIKPSIANELHKKYAYVFGYSFPPPQKIKDQVQTEPSKQPDYVRILETTSLTSGL